MLLLALVSTAAPLRLSQASDALTAANEAAAAAAAAAAAPAAAPAAAASVTDTAAASGDDCVSYTSVTGDSVITAWCEANCKMAGFQCPEEKCNCITRAAVQEQAASIASAGAELVTSLPKIASQISGPWFYCADGTPHEPIGAQRHEQWGQDYELNAPRGRELPDWLAATSKSGNAVTLAFMDPLELGTPGNGVPAAFAEYTYLLRQGEENRDRQIFFAIGGMAFKGFDFLGNSEAAEKAGADACEVATKHGVGIEIDHEGSQGNDVEGLKSFVKGFRRDCPMGKFPLSMDIMGGPGGAGLTWAADAVSQLVPQDDGVPGDVADGDYFDFVNLMARPPHLTSRPHRVTRTQRSNAEGAVLTTNAPAVKSELYSWESSTPRDSWRWPLPPSWDGSISLPSRVHFPHVHDHAAPSAGDRRVHERGMPGFFLVAVEGHVQPQLQAGYLLIHGVAHL